MRWRRREEDLDRELRAHVEAETEEQKQAGLAPEEARYAAQRMLGNITMLKEDTRSIWSWSVLERFAQDLRYALRTLRKSPGFTAVAVLSLALGVGANTAIFTFVNAALLRPLPYPEADRIVALYQLMAKGTPTNLVHPRSFIEWHDRMRSFEALAIAQPIPVNTEGNDGAEQVPGMWATEELFRVFGVEPFLGRAYTAEEARPGASPVVVLSHGYWQRRFGSDPGIVGKPMRMGRGSRVVIGVMPPGFRVAASNIDIFSPLPLDRNKPEAAGSRGFQCYGRLRPGVTLAAARAEMRVAADQISHSYPPDRRYQIDGWSVTMVSLRDLLVQDSRRVLLLLLAVVALVLLIACANLAGLLLTRGVGRQSELALRASLGAGRWRLIQQLLIESLALSVLGSALGLLLGVWANQALVFLAKDAVAFGQIEDVHLDIRVLGFTLLLSLLTAVAFGLAPAWQLSRFNLQTALKGHGRGAGGNRGQQRLRAALVIGEVALAVVLLVGAGLLLRTFTRLLDVKLGFEPEQVLTLRTFLTGDPARRSNLIESVLERVETLPEVRAAGIIQFLPFGGHTNQGPFHFVGRAQPADPESMESDVSTVSRGYFAAMGIPVLSGRPFGRQDRIDSPRVAVVNQSFVKKYCPNQDPIGQRILGDWSNPKPTEIVGVVGDIRHNGLTTDPRPTVFLAQAQLPGYISYLVVRTAGSPERLASAIRRELQQVDRNQPFTAIQPMRQYVSAALARPRLYAVLLGAFASLAVVLAAIGLYGLMAYTVRQRTHEIGVRMALGAQRGDVLQAMLGQGARLALAGLVLGLVVAMGLRDLLSSLLYGISVGDPMTYVGVAAVLGGVALIAAYIPARRAARVDPMVALRYE
jgi:putative ABC transport system permease protein